MGEQIIDSDYMPTARVNVLIVDDHVVFRVGLTKVLSESGAFKVVGNGARTSDVIIQAQDLSPTLSIVGLQSHKSRITAVAEIRKKLPHIKIVLLVDSQMDEDPEDNIFGVVGYIERSSDPEKLISTFGDIGKCHYRTLKERYEHGLVFQDKNADEYVNLKQIMVLSGMEMDALSFLSYGYSNKEIAESLGIEPLAVKTHICRILKKLGKNRIEAAQFGRDYLRQSKKYL